MTEITIFTDDGKINAQGGKFAGLMRFDAREAVEKELTALVCIHAALVWLLSCRRLMTSRGRAEVKLHRQYRPCFPGIAGSVPRQEAQPNAFRSVLSVQRRHRADAETAVVGQLQQHGKAGGRRSARRLAAHHSLHSRVCGVAWRGVAWLGEMDAHDRVPWLCT